MIDPTTFPLEPLIPYHCINVFTGHIRGRQHMTPRMADYINSCNHMKDTGYKWMECSQTDFGLSGSVPYSLEVINEGSD